MQWFFVTGLSVDTEAKDILDFLKTKNIIQACTCEKMITKNKSIGSFKLGVPKENKGEILNPEFWPAGIRINHFLNLQRRQANHGHSTTGP